jgi:hypothetical protein
MQAAALGPPPSCNIDGPGSNRVWQTHGLTVAPGMLPKTKLSTGFSALLIVKNREKQTRPEGRRGFWNTAWGQFWELTLSRN